MRSTQLEKFINDINSSIDGVDDSRLAGGREGVKESIKRHCRLLENEFLIEDNKQIIRKRSNEREDDSTEIEEKGLAEIISEGPTAFVFGAGISMGKPFKLPNWSGLLRHSIIGEFYDDYDVSIEYDDFYKELTDQKSFSKDFFSSFDLYELGEFLENHRRDVSIRESEYIDYTLDQEMCTIVENALTRGINSSVWKHDSSGYSLTNSRSLDNSFIKSISDKAKEIGVKRILTYNYDNAFEYVYSKENAIKPIFVDDQLPNADDGHHLPIYHVHGYLPIFKCENSVADVSDYLKRREAKKLILSEGSYDEMAHASYKWRNTVQIDTFMRYNCVFFGFSATDINFKRIVKLMDWHTDYTIDDSADEPAVKHVIFMAVDDFIKNIFGDNLLSIDKENYRIDFDSKKVNASNLKELDAKLKFLYYALRMKRKYIRKMHIYPIWTTIYGQEKYVEDILKEYRG